MDKVTFDKQLKNDALANKFRIEADFIIFDKNSNLDYLIIPNFTLRNLLTKNILSSYTKLSKTLLLWLHRLRAEYGKPIFCNSGYRSPEYNLTIPGSAKDSWHTKGMAMDCGCAEPEQLKACAEKLLFVGELGLYDSFIHIAPQVGENTRWDNRKKKNILNYLDSDEKRNYAIMGVVSFFAALFLFFRRRS